MICRSRFPEGHTSRSAPTGKRCQLARGHAGFCFHKWWQWPNGSRARCAEIWNARTKDGGK